MTTTELKNILKRIKKALKHKNPERALVQIERIIEGTKCFYCSNRKRGGKQFGCGLCESCYRDGV
jgi:hypothetical protein